jgi:membrane protease YdiL (CAAX protease family)
VNQHESTDPEPERAEAGRGFDLGPVVSAQDSRWGLGDVATGILAAQILSIFVIGFVYAASGWSTDNEPPLWATALLQTPLWAGYIGATWVAGSKGRGLADFGWASRATDAAVGLPVGIATQLIIVPLVYRPILWILDSSADELAEPARELADRASGNLGWVVLFVMTSLCAPVVEELFYRGLLLRSLVKRGFPTVLSVVLSAAIFAGMHFQWLQFAGLFVFGLVLALMSAWYKRLGPAIWAHVGFNATTVLSLYLDSR